LLFLQKERPGNQFPGHRNPFSIRFQIGKDKAENQDRSLLKAPKRADYGDKESEDNGADARERG